MIAAIAAKIFSNRYYHMEIILLLLSQDRLKFYLDDRRNHKPVVGSIAHIFLYRLKRF